MYALHRRQRDEVHDDVAETLFSMGRELTKVIRAKSESQNVKLAATKKPVGKKATGKKRSKKKKSGKKVTRNAAAPAKSVEAKRLAKVVRQTEKTLEKASRQLDDARERVASAAMTARTKRTIAAHAVVSRAREGLASINERHLAVITRLRAAREAIAKPHTTGLDWDAHTQSLKDALERYEEILNQHDRRVRGRAADRRKR